MHACLCDHGTTRKIYKQLLSVNFLVGPQLYIVEYVLMRSCTIGVPNDLPEDWKKHATKIQVLSGSQILRSDPEI